MVHPGLLQRDQVLLLRSRALLGQVKEPDEQNPGQVKKLDALDNDVQRAEGGHVRGDPSCC